ncbi:MAG: hypothetical protein GMKNLPBB_00144 [Myxococcota bacterium]|nr:hypothetical protein [Myxococcota bacterium]
MGRAAAGEGGAEVIGVRLKTPRRLVAGLLLWLSCSGFAPLRQADGSFPEKLENTGFSQWKARRSARLAAVILATPDERLDWLFNELSRLQDAEEVRVYAEEWVAAFRQAQVGCEPAMDLLRQVQGRLRVPPEPRANDGSSIGGWLEAGLSSLDQACRKNLMDELTLATETAMEELPWWEEQEPALVVTVVLGGLILVVWMGVRTWAWFRRRRALEEMNRE